MAGLGRKTFAAGEVLTASNVMGYLQDQAVMNFAGTAARSSAIATPSEGMVSYLADSNIVEVYDGTNWRKMFGTTGSILQLVSTTKTDTFSASTATASITADVTGLTVSITPNNASNKIYISGSINVSATSNVAVTATLFRNGSIVQTYTGDAASTRARVASGGANPTNDADNMSSSLSFQFLDSPASVSEQTYSIRLRHGSTSTTTIYLNRGPTDTDASRASRQASTITAMEISA